MDLRLKNKVIIINRCYDGLTKLEDAIINKIIKAGCSPYFIENDVHGHIVVKHLNRVIITTTSIKNTFVAVFNIRKKIDVVISKTDYTIGSLNAPLENVLTQLAFSKNYHQLIMDCATPYLNASQGNMLILNPNEDQINTYDPLNDYSNLHSDNGALFNVNHQPVPNNNVKQNMVYFSEQTIDNLDFLVNQCLLLISGRSISNQKIIYKDNRVLFSN
ncbi:hypothetical protein ACFFU1_14955 [Algibacter miyuki]|uniref:Uncharacterized protein n=1 Tax=Algibacter miyuki TaxID=1306933 RepID=A0ABV5H377_9FLAO|nr:hypothetical protein [Algibacter miyuki]MDN3663887.1 hypothetical protein [Algibacter miyuki]